MPLDKNRLGNSIITALTDAGFKFDLDKSPNNKDFIRIISEQIVTEIKTNALVTGTTPATGGPLTNGKVS